MKPLIRSGTISSHQPQVFGAELNDISMTVEFLEWPHRHADDVEGRRGGAIRLAVVILRPPPVLSEKIHHQNLPRGFVRIATLLLVAVGDLSTVGEVLGELALQSAANEDGPPGSPAPVQRRGWEIHPRGRPVLQANAERIVQCLTLAAQRDLVIQSVDLCQSLAFPPELTKGTWEATDRISWSYLERFPIPVNDLVQRLRNQATDLNSPQFDEPDHTAHWIPAVTLHGPGEPPSVLGHTMARPLSPTGYKVIHAMLQAGADGLLKRQLEVVAPSARSILNRLEKQHSLWGVAICREGSWTGYRIASVW